MRPRRQPVAGSTVGSRVRVTSEVKLGCRRASAWSTSSANSSLWSRTERTSRAGRAKPVPSAWRRIARIGARPEPPARHSTGSSSAWQMEAAVGPVERERAAEPSLPVQPAARLAVLVARDEELEQPVDRHALAVGRVGDRVGPGLGDARRPQLDVLAGAVAEAHLPGQRQHQAAERRRQRLGRDHLGHRLERRGRRVLGAGDRVVGPDHEACRSAACSGRSGTCRPPSPRRRSRSSSASRGRPRLPPRPTCRCRRRRPAVVRQADAGGEPASRISSPAGHSKLWPVLATVTRQIPAAASCAMGCSRCCGRHRPASTAWTEAGH